MTRAELIETIKNGENSSIAFIRAPGEERALARDLVAFANFRGGRVLLGVDRDGTAGGVTQSNPKQWVLATCQEKIRPPLIPWVEVVRDAQPRRDVLVVQVVRGWCGHYLLEDNHPTYFIRIGTQSQEASKEQIRHLFQERGTFRTELRPVSGSSIEDLDGRRLRDYFVRVRQQEVPPDQGQEGWDRLLTCTGILSEEGDKSPATVAGLLLFAKNPNTFLPQAGIVAVAYLRPQSNYPAKERLALRGPMVPLFGERGLIENGVVEQAIEFVRRNTEVTTTPDQGGGRVERCDYPGEVVKEATLNALVHRDYLLSDADIELTVYPERLEIISPGRPPNGITPERMRAGCRAARNHLLQDVMRDYGYVEHLGMGVPRKIVKGMREHNGTEPDLVEQEDRFSLRLWKEKKSL